MRATFYMMSFLMVFLLNACEKNDPITELGETNGEFAAELRTNFNNSAPSIGDSVTITASMWQRDDKFKEVRFLETVVEAFGLDLTLKKGTKVLTSEDDISTLVVTDTVLNRYEYKKVIADTLDRFYVTASHNYVIPQKYYFLKKTGAFPDDASLISYLEEDDFEILKGVLAYKVTAEDYIDMFPSAPSTHYTASGLTLAGREYFRQNLTKEQLVSQVEAIAKVGTYDITLDIEVVTPTGTVTSANRVYNIKF